MLTGLSLFLVALEKSAAKGSSASLLACATTFVLLCCADRPATKERQPLSCCPDSKHPQQICTD